MFKMILFRPLNKTCSGGGKFQWSEMKSGFLSWMMLQRIYLFILLFSLLVLASEVDFPAIFQSEFFPLPLYRWPPPGKPCVAPYSFGCITPDCGSQLSRCHHVVTPWKFSSWPHSKLANERCPLFTLRFYELWMIPWIWQILNKCLM